MAMTLKEIRQKYPDYDDLSDTELADKIHSKFYADLPKEDVYSKLGLGTDTGTEPREENEPKERTGLLGVVSDVARGAGNAVKGGIKFAADTPKMLEEEGKYIEKHPFTALPHNVGQVAAEGADIGKSLVNAPHDLLKYFLKKHLAVDIPIPGTNWHTSDLIPHIPEDTGVEKALGLTPGKEDRLVRGLTEGASLVAGGAPLVKGVKKLFEVPDLKESIRKTQTTVNKATSEAGKIFDKVENEVDAKGLSKVPIDQEVIKQSQTFLAKTPANKALIEKASSGDYKALRSLQADLRVKGEKALSSALSAENTMGEEILATRDQVNQSIQQHLEDTGYEDLAKLLNKARNDYRDIQQTYFSTPQLAKVFGKSQRVPKNPKNLLTEESTEMNKFMEAHPEVKLALAKALKHESKMRKLKKAGSILGIGTTAEAAREILGGK